MSKPTVAEVKKAMGFVSEQRKTCVYCKHSMWVSPSGKSYECSYWEGRPFRVDEDDRCDKWEKSDWKLQNS